MGFIRMVVLLAAFSTTATTLFSAEPKKISTVEGLTEYQLENGLKVVIFPEPSVAKITVNMTILVGSRHEGYGEAGMAHLLEHMLFKPTPSHARPDQELEARGAKYNGTTYYDRTNYYETLPASDENLEWAIAWEADRLVNCPIKAEDLASEMTVVRNEFEMGENNASMILEQRVMATAYEWHNYGKSTIGNRADIERVPADSLRAFYKKYYRPDNVVLFVGGRLDEAHALELVQKHFGAIPRPSEPIRMTYTEEPAQDGERLVNLRRVGNVAVVGVAYHIPALADDEYAAAAILEATMTADKTGRLYKALVERRLASKIQGMAYGFHDPGVIYMSAEVVPGNEPNAVVEAMIDAIDEVVNKGVTQTEVSRAQLQFRKYFDQLSADTAKFLVELTELAASGDWRLFFLNRDRIAKVTVDDVNRVAKKYLQTSNRTVGVYLPSKEPQRTPVAPPPEVGPLVRDYRGNEESGAAEKFDASPAAIEARIKRSDVDGLKVALLPKKTRGKTVVLQFNLRYGKLETLHGQAEACELLPTLMARATKKLNSEQLADKLDELQTTLVPSGGPGEVTFMMQTKRDNLIAAIDVLRQVTREPALQSTELDIIKQKRIGELEEQSVEPQMLAVRFVRQKLNPYPAGDVRHQPSMPEELKLVQGVNVDSIKQIHDQFLSSQAGEIVIVGDFDEAEVKKALASSFAGWKSKQPYERIVRKGDQSPKPETAKINTPDKANAMYFSGLLLPMRDDNPDYPALLVANEILGGSGFASRLMSRIREKEGLSYGVASSFRSSAVDPRTTLTIYAICNPVNVEKVVALAKEELERMIKDGVTAEELSEAQEGLVKGQEADRGDDVKLTPIIANDLYAGRTMEYYAKLAEKVRAVKRDDVTAALRKYVDPNKFVHAIAGDLKK